MRHIRSNPQRIYFDQRLRRITQQILVTALTLVTVIVIVSSLILNLNSMIAENQVKARVLADNVSASLLFGDKRVAKELLQTLRHSPNVHAAAIFDENGKPFARYMVSGKEAPVSLEEGHDEVTLGMSYIELLRPVVHEGRILGQLYLSISLAALYGLIFWEILITLAAATTALFMGRVLLARLSTSVMQPLSDLAGVMDRVSKKADYKVRAQPSDIFELDSLSRGLNSMLEQIQVRDTSLAAYRNHLEEEVTARTSQLQTAKDEAEQANNAKSDFLSSMSHELRTPMNAILGFSQLLQLEELDEAQLANVNEIYNAGEHLLELINEVLDLSRIESGRIDLSIESVALKDIFKECLSLVNAIAIRNEISISVEKTVCHDVIVRADHTRLRQILLNLLSNAVKYNRKGGEVNVDCHLQSNGDVRINVKDTGPGISQEKQADLFTAFNRLGAEQTEIEGTGIGLMITRNIVELMGGNIGVESEPGRGSTFWIELPCEEIVATKKIVSEITEPVLPTHTSGRNYRLLYVEDNPANLRLVNKLLEHRSHITLHTAHTPQLGLDLIISQSFDLILLDINLPGMSGFDMLKKIREEEKTKNIPVIAISANAMKNDVEKGLAAGFNAYLTKPINVDSFFHAIDDLLINSSDPCAQNV